MLFLTLLWLHVSQQHSDNNLNFSRAHTLVTYGMTCSAHPQTHKKENKDKNHLNKSVKTTKLQKCKKSVQHLISLQVPDFMIVL